MQSALLLLLLVAFQASLCEWSDPVKLVEMKGTAPWAASVYRDPSTSLNHAIVCVGTQYRYLAVKDDGSVVHDHVFPSDSDAYAARAVIKGAGNGKNLFVAFRYTIDRRVMRTVNVTESKDGGESWTVPVSALSMNGAKEFLDMLYISETGRVFIFFTELFTSTHELRMVSRPANSRVFSGETVIVSSGLGADARVAYTPVGARQYIYITYVTPWTSQLMYTRSTTNGADWSVPKEIANEDGVWHIRHVIAGAKLDSNVYIVYAAKRGPQKLLVSSDHGASFNKPVPFTIKSSNFWSTDGVAVCAAEGGLHKLVALSRVDGNAAEYAIWDMKKMAATRKQHPFKSFWGIYTTGVECAVDGGKKQMVTAGFATATNDRKVYGLYFAADLEAFEA